MLGKPRSIAQLAVFASDGRRGFWIAGLAAAVATMVESTETASAYIQAFG